MLIFLKQYGPSFGDIRLSRRMDDLLSLMITGESNIIHKIVPDSASETASYRFLKNDQVEMGQMIGHLVSPVRDLVSGKDVLILSDSSEVSLQSQINRIRDADRVGVLSDNKTAGFHKHVSMCLDAKTGSGLGLSDLFLWNRPRSNLSKSEKSQRKRNRSWPEKETYKWALSVKHSEVVLAKAARQTYVFDAGADFDALWRFASQSPRDFLIRLKYNRFVRPTEADSTLDSPLQVKLFEHLAAQDCAGQYQLELRALTGRNIYQPKFRQARTAKMEVKYTAVNLEGSESLRPFYIVEAKEAASTVPEDEPPIHWILLTTHKIETFDQACKGIHWYSLRWMIEELFRTSKKKGFDIESSELEYLDSIMKQTIMTMQAALKVMQLVLARDNPQAQSISHCFSPEQIMCLQALNRKYQGKTKKQHNPYPKDRLSWASWIIGRLGGWKGYQKARPPGPIRMKRGLEKFYQMFQGWKLLYDGQLMIDP
ncbi:MAG: IS4 family transposase [Cyanobacteria bacterium J06600_6]